MDTSKRRSGVRNGVVAGSVWERRMRSDEVKGGIRVFGVVEDDDNGTASDVPTAPSSVTLRKSEVAGKRRTWKSESIDGPIQIAREVNESSNSLDEHVKEMSFSGDGIKKRKSPNLGVKEKRELGISQEIKSRPEAKKVSESVLGSEKVVSADLRKKNLEPSKDLCQSGRGGSEENCKEVGVCQERIISSTMSDVGQVKAAPKVLFHDYDLHGNHGNDDGDEEFFDDEGLEAHCIDEKAETKVEKQRFDIEKIHTSEQRSKKVASGEKVDNHFSEKHKPICFDAVKRPSMLNRNGVQRSTAYTPPSKPTSLWATEESPAATKYSTIHQNFAKHNTLSDENRRSRETQEGWQILVDLVMWKNAHKSALAFAIGTLLIISSSYAKHLDCGFISLVSYLSLIILAAIFVYKSVTSRGYVDVAAMRCECEEEEAMRLVKLVLPCYNKFLFMLRAVLSGDPSTTMKLAVLLYVVAKCGSYITGGMMVKLGFFGAFIVPKLCFTYSGHMTTQGKIWIQLFRDSWGVCSHKKAVAAAALLIFWSFSSIVGRVWGVFFAYIAFRYYEQTA
ncbi:reticulon-like protein B21 [Syzygium oleosum]|uniref:reticulon-like protein B21 n=1 Tax=Syzygium oleosum TaxID=219896 RepID=UPI0024BB7536|nr:reticulon-like protein B21 [Syzygium oleosum]